MLMTTADVVFTATWYDLYRRIRPSGSPTRGECGSVALVPKDFATHKLNNGQGKLVKPPNFDIRGTYKSSRRNMKSGPFRTSPLTFKYVHLWIAK